VLDGCGAGVFLEDRFGALAARSIGSGRVPSSRDGVGERRFDAARLDGVHLNDGPCLWKRDWAEDQRANAGVVKSDASARRRAVDSHRDRIPAARRRLGLRHRKAGRRPGRLVAMPRQGPRLSLIQHDASCGHKVEMVAGTKALRIEYRLTVAQRKVRGTQIHLVHNRRAVVTTR
jgi:hypothetical protein